MNADTRYPLYVGIDLGTTNTVVTYYTRSEDPKLMVLDFGLESFLPSAVFIARDGSVLVGRQALNAGVLEPERLILASKRFLDRIDFIYPADSPEPLNFNETYSPKDITRYILSEVRNELIRQGIADETEDIHAVISTPAYCNDLQKDNTVSAAREAGFTVDRYIDEPVAAAYSYSNEYILNKNAKLFVFDFGGGTLDFTTLDYTGTIKSITNKNKDGYFSPPYGDQNLGGMYIDKLIEDYLFNLIRNDLGIDTSTIEMFKESNIDENGDTIFPYVCDTDDNQFINAYNSFRHRISQLAVELKHSLSINQEYHNSLMDPLQGMIYTGGSEDQMSDYILKFELTREMFEQEIMQSILERIKERLDEYFKFNDNVEKDKITQVLMVGGSSRIPCVRRFLSEYFSCEVVIEDPAMSISKGAALAAYMQSAPADNEEDDDNNSNTGNGISGNLPPASVLGMDFGIAVYDKNYPNERRFDIISPRGKELPFSDYHLYHPMYKGASEVGIVAYNKRSIDPSDLSLSDDDIIVRTVFTDFTPSSDPEPVIKVTFEHRLDGTLAITAVESDKDGNDKGPVIKIK